MKRVAVVLSLLLLVFAVSVQTQTPAPSPPPEMKALEMFIGDWTYEGEANESPIGPAAKISGKSTVRWILDGFFQECRYVEKGAFGDSETIQIDWYDAATKSYHYRSFRNNGETLSGSYTVSGKVVKYTQVNILTNGTQYMFRGTNTVSDDGMIISWQEEISTDGKTWSPFAKAKHTKVKPAK